MIRTLRGAWSRRWTLLPLLLLTAVVVAGLVAVLALAEGAQTSEAVTVPLLLLGLVAVPATGRQLAAARRGEIALARLRGITGGQLYAVLALEPFLVLVAGALVGVTAGLGLAVVVAHTWIGTDTTTIGPSLVTAVVGVVVVALVAVLAGMAGAMRESLSEQVAIAERPRPSSTAALFGSVLLLVGAAIAIYRSTAAAAGDGDWLVLAGPALVGLAVGQIAVWLLRLSGRVAVAATARRGVPAFLATRRLARVADAASPIRLVVAACVVAAVAMTGAQQVGEWSEGTARIRAGAPIHVPFDGDVVQALGLTRQLDPDGDYLMAAALVPGEGSVPARRVFLDTERFDAVLGDFYDGSAAAGVRDRLGDLAASDGATIAVGDTIEGAVRGVSRRLGGSLHPIVIVQYTNDAAQAAEARLDFTVDTTGAAATASTQVDDCARGCVVTGLVLGRPAADDHLPFVLTELRMSDVDMLKGTYVSTTPSRFGNPGGPLAVDDGLMALAERNRQTSEVDGGGPRTPILATVTATWTDGPVQIDSPGGDERPAEVLDRVPALPLVEADGLLADLPLSSVGALPTVPAAQVMVLVAADTPAGMLSDLTEATGTDAVTLAAVEQATDEEVGAVQARVYALIALFCLAVAILVMAASVARLRATHLREVAALRLLGIDLRVLRRSGWLELGALALAAIVAAAAGGVAAVRLLLSNLDLVTVPVHGVPLEIHVALVPVAGAALVAALVVAVVGGRSRAVRSDLGRPAQLREQSR